MLRHALALALLLLATLPGADRRALPNDFGSVVTTPGYTPEQTKLIIGISVVHGTPGSPMHCVTNITAVLAVPVSARVTPTGIRFEGNFALWNHLRLNRAAAADTPQRLVEIVTGEADLIVEAWRAANAAAAPPATMPRPDARPAHSQAVAGSGRSVAIDVCSHPGSCS